MSGKATLLDAYMNAKIPPLRGSWTESDETAEETYRYKDVLRSYGRLAGIMGESGDKLHMLMALQKQGDGSLLDSLCLQLAYAGDKTDAVRHAMEYLGDELPWAFQRAADHDIMLPKAMVDKAKAQLDLLSETLEPAIAEQKKKLDAFTALTPGEQKRIVELTYRIIEKYSPDGKEALSPDYKVKAAFENMRRLLHNTLAMQESIALMRDDLDTLTQRMSRGGRAQG